MWPDRRILDLLRIEVPIIQAPMAGASGAAMAIAVAEAGGLGSLPCAILSLDGIRDELRRIRQHTSRPVNVNFFCHHPPAADPAREADWLARLRRYYSELNLEPAGMSGPPPRDAFDEALCDLMTELRPEIISFHFGLPARPLLDRVKQLGARILSTATSVEEARVLEDAGCDAVIAQGYEAGGHQGMFLSQDPARQAGTMALVPQVADAVRIPVIAAGGVADGRGIAAAVALGASAVQIGTAFLLCPESTITPLHRNALRRATANASVLTNVFTGRPARSLVNRLVDEVGPMSHLAPSFPLAYDAVAPLRAKAEEAGSTDFSPLWSGQAAALAREMPAGELIRRLAADALERMARLTR